MIEARPVVASAPAPHSVVRHWPGMRSEYAWVPPHAGLADAATVTRELQIGVAIAAHRGLVYESGGRTVTADIAPGSAIISGNAPISWLRVHEVTEALEIYPDPDLLRTSAGASLKGSSDAAQLVRQFVGQRDGTVLGIGSVLRRAHVCGTSLSDVAASTLAHRLVHHVLSRYAGDRIRPPTRAGLLDARAVDRVTEYIDAGLHDILTLDDLAAVVRLSVFHFARAFTLTTGSPPHRFVTSRRMDRARQLLWTSDRTVEDVAGAVGYSNLSHFRRTFRQFHGVAPSALRA